MDGWKRAPTFPKQPHTPMEGMHVVLCGLAGPSHFISTLVSGRRARYLACVCRWWYTVGVGVSHLKVPNSTAYLALVPKNRGKPRRPSTKKKLFGAGYSTSWHLCSATPDRKKKYKPLLHFANYIHSIGTASRRGRISRIKGGQILSMNSSVSS